eukprot:CAMPEP_0184870274 /NCGR_PEP_ID=MMETSP0580-20130426/36937_1 /TAXON_ID=1118495 /ORGANISM="Dactyliosolen fragilissimus" /LENGTH=130 /DNA_ID=CAMNT_0027372265 /DNA_START=14 /DNA_END=402 /DNA_ORIENTATION=-
MPFLNLEKSISSKSLPIVLGRTDRKFEMLHRSASENKISRLQSNLSMQLNDETTRRQNDFGIGREPINGGDDDLKLSLTGLAYEIKSMKNQIIEQDKRQRLEWAIANSGLNSFSFVSASGVEMNSRDIVT